MKCQNCGIYEAVVKDYREIAGTTSSIASCIYCINLDDVSHIKVHSEKLNPKVLLED